MAAGARRFMAAVLLAALCACDVARAATLPFSRNPGSTVFELTEEAFQAQLLGGRYVWAVAFVDSGSADARQLQFAEVWEGVGAKLRGLVRVGAVDRATAFGRQLTDQFQMKELPVVLCFPSPLFADPKRYGAIPFVGDLQEQALVNWAAKQLPGQLVVPIKDQATYDKLLESDEYPKVVHWSKAGTPAYLKALTLELVNRFSFAEVPPAAAAVGADLAAERPALAVFTAANEAPVAYAGSFTYSALLDFLLPYARTDEELEAFMKRKEEEVKELREKQKQQKAAPKGKAAKPKPEPKPPARVVRVHTPEGFEQEVAQRAGTTFVAFLDPQDEHHKAYLRTLHGLLQRMQRGGSRFHVAWLDGVQQGDLAEALTGDRGQFPTGAFVHPKNQWRKPLVGAFTEAGIWKFSQGALLQGAGKPLGQLPAFAAEANPDGLHELTPEDLAGDAGGKAPAAGEAEEPARKAKEAPTAKDPPAAKAGGKAAEQKKAEKPQKPLDPEQEAKAAQRREEVRLRNEQREERLRQERDARARQRQEEKERRDAQLQKEKERNEKRRARREQREAKEREAQAQERRRQKQQQKKAARRKARRDDDDEL